MQVGVSIGSPLALGLGCQVYGLNCPEAVFPDQTECANQALKAHEWPVYMLLLDLFFLLLLLLCASEKQPGGPHLNLRAADHHTKNLGDKTNIKIVRDAYVDCLRAETVSLRALLFE